MHRRLQDSLVTAPDACSGLVDSMEIFRPRGPHCETPFARSAESMPNCNKEGGHD